MSAEDLTETLAAMREDAKRGDMIAGAFIQHNWASRVNVHDWYRGEVAKLTRDLESALSAVEGVLAVHTPTYPSTGPDMACFHCFGVPTSDGSGTWVEWPCPTVKTITDALGGIE